MFRKDSYKHLDEKNKVGLGNNNAFIELNMEDLARMVFNANYGLERFVGAFDTLAKESGDEWKITKAKALIKAMEEIEK